MDSHVPARGHGEAVFSLPLVRPNLIFHHTVAFYFQNDREGVNFKESGEGP